MFINCTLNESVNSGIFIAHKLLSPYSVMSKELKQKTDWKYDTPDNFLEILTTYKGKINVYTFRPKNPWSKVIAYYERDAINFNIRKLPDLGSVAIAGTLIHELCHHLGIHHGTGRLRNYKTQDKSLYSVPYYISDNIHKWV